MSILMVVNAEQELRERYFLDAKQEGILHAFERHCWIHGNLPNDEHALMSIAKSKPKDLSQDKEVVNTLIEQYFVRLPNGLIHSPQIEKSRKDLAAKADAASSKARKAAQARWGK